MSIRVTHTEEVICDICYRPISDIPHCGLWGTRFTMQERIFGKPKHADICDDCQRIIIKAAERKEQTND